MFINKILLRFAKGSVQKIIHAVLFQLLMTGIVSATALCMSFLIRDFITSILLNREVLFTRKSMILIIGILTLLLSAKFLSTIQVRIVMNAGVSIKDTVRTNIFQKLFLLGPAYSSMTRTGTLTSILTSRVEWLMNYYTRYMPAVVSAVINAAVFISFLTYVDVYTGIASCFSVCMMLCIPMLFFNLMRERGAEEWKWHGLYSSECLDGIQGMVTLKSFNADTHYGIELKKSGESYRRAVMAHLRVTIIEGSFLEFFVRAGTALTIVILAWRCAAGFVDREFLIISFFAIGAAFSPMISLINAWHLGFQGVSASYSIEDFLQFKAEYILANTVLPSVLVERKIFQTYLDTKDFSKVIQPVETANVTLKVKNVQFRYTGEVRNAIEDISVELTTGKMIALVGGSGSGKSTIAGLISGFYRPNSGSIMMNDTVLSNDTVEYFQNNISAVWQDNHLFAGSIYDNIKMGKWYAKAEDVYAAAQKALIHDVIMTLPQGYMTPVSELGGLFSTGERQRIAIARALLKDAPVLILDEATSSLDRETEKGIQNILQDLKTKKAILVIAHRIQTIEMADEICFLHKGSLIAHDTHHNLLLKSDEYKELLQGCVLS